MSPPRSPLHSRASTGSTSGPRGSRPARPPRSSASSARSTPPTPGSPAAREPRVPGPPAGRRRRGCPPGEPRAARPARPGALCGQVEPPRRAREPRRDHARGGGAAVVTKRLDEVAADALVVGLSAAEKTLPDTLARLDRAAGGHLKAALEAESFKAKAGQVMHVHTGKSRVVVAGLGPRAETTLEVLRRSAAAALRRARDLGARTVAAEVLGDRLPAPQRAQALVEGALLGTYTFDRYKKEKPERAVEELRIVDGEPAPGART